MKISVRGRRPSPSTAIAFVALLVALGGSSYAAVTLPAKSVGAKQLKAKAVGRAQMKANAVDGTKVADNSLTGDDIAEASLGKVPGAAAADRAASADRAAAADHATAATGLDALAYKTMTGAVPPAPSAQGTATAVATAFCDGGQHVTAGGVKLDDPTNTAVVDSYPDFNGTGWTTHVDNSDTAASHGFSVYAVCIPSG